MVKFNKIDEIRLDGGILCLDFVNTVHDRIRKPVRDYFNNAEDIVRWGKRTGILNDTSYELLNKKIDSALLDEALFYSKALELRELLYGIFSKIVRKITLSGEELKSFNEYLTVYYNSIAIKYIESKLTESWKWKGEDLNRILLLVVRSARDLLLSERLDRVKECPNCGWLFFDTTKNGKRRWCSMKSCGSSVKALDYYYRKKKAV